MNRIGKTVAVVAAPAMALAMLAATPADAQSRYYGDRYYGQDRRDRDDDRGEKALIGAALGAVAGAIVGNGDGSYVAGGALAGAAVGAATGSRSNDCSYYRGGRCYRNQGHWEREHGINSRDYRGGYDYRYGDRGRRDYRHDRRW